MEWNRLSACLLTEASPPNQPTEKIYAALTSVLEPLANELEKGQYKDAALTVSSALEPFGVQAHVRGDDEPRKATHAYCMPNRQNDESSVVISIDGPGLKSIATVSEFNPIGFSRRILKSHLRATANLISHELIHRWQLKRSKNLAATSDISTIEKYISNPHEIAARAHQIVDEVGAIKIKEMLANKTLNFKSLGDFSSTVWDVLYGLENVPGHLSTRVKKRYMMHIINIARNAP